MLGWIKLSHGGTTATITDAKIIYALALITNTHSLILCHNHPSGNIRPSEADKELTKTIRKAGILINIDLLDHLIISPEEEYFSFADSGQLD